VPEDNDPEEGTLETMDELFQMIVNGIDMDGLVE